MTEQTLPVKIDGYRIRIADIGQELVEMLTANTHSRDDLARIVSLNDERRQLWVLLRDTQYHLADSTKEVELSDYHEYLKSEHWQTVRSIALDFAEHHCQLCYSKEQLEVHHRTYERRGNERLSDVIVLCRNCHAKFHDKLP